MQKIDKNYDTILSTKYKKWVDNLEKNKKKHPESISRNRYDDIVMELYRCQKGVCAYTERFICPPNLYKSDNWIDGDYKITDEAEFKRTDHAGELEHFDHHLKENQYWLWSNLFMIDSTINSRKSSKDIVYYLKPDSEDYSPEKYFDYDEETHRFIPNTDLDIEQRTEIKDMIDNVFYLNHGVILNDRRDFINDLKAKINNKSPYKFDRFFTATKMCLENILP
jgi:hypothetical protein